MDYIIINLDSHDLLNKRNEIKNNACPGDANVEMDMWCEQNR